MTDAPLLRIANCSGFFGDRLSAAREMVEGGPIDVLTGDWLAELTMYILHKTRERTGGFARTFLRQMEEVLPRCAERGIRVVSNAGGLNPEGLAAAVRELARRQGVSVRVAAVSGDDLAPRLADLRAAGHPFVNLDTGEALPSDAPVVSANAYLGARPIADALAAGADVVVTGRVTDASLTVGPAMHAFGWSDGDVDAIAGAVVAGHVIECGAQCCGGNYAFYEDVPGADRIGFPIAELAADGSAVITKHPGTGGMVTVGTVTAQLLYEIAGPRYLSPDAVAHFDTIDLASVGPDRVRISGVRGERPPSTLKVTANLEAGWRNAMILVLSGDDAPGKARLAADAVWAGIAGGRDAFTESAEELAGDVEGGGTAFLRLAVRGDDEIAVGRAFSGAVIETSLASYPGTFFTTAPSGAQGVARYWPSTIDAAAVVPVITLDEEPVAASPRSLDEPDRAPHVELADGGGGGNGDTDGDAAGAPGNDVLSDGARGVAEEVTVPLWVLVGGRSGDKGGDANVGLWADSVPVARWLLEEFDVARFKEALPEAASYDVDRYPLPNLQAVNFVVHGVLGWGVASNLRLDTQAKGMAERLRAHRLQVPAALVAHGRPAERLLTWQRAH